MGFDPLFLARLQFTLNISFHILFPTITIGLAWILLYFRLKYTISRDRAWEYAYFFWVKIFALSFALGVVSGITMSFQFGTNWPGFIEKTGNIAGPLLGYEVLTAFFLEATFLGVMLFGKNRVSNRTHLLATSLVAIGTTISAFWILSLNSWMQTPQGFSIADGRFFAEDWLAIIFNPSFPYRFVHMSLASLLTSAFLIAGVSAWRFNKGVDGPATLLVLKTGVLMAAILIPVQIFIGDLHGLNTLKHQPAKIAAIEAIWNTEHGAPFTVVGFPDETNRTTNLAVKIPKAASLILTHQLDGEVKGLNEFEGEHPPVAIVFWSFRVMLAMAGLMLLVSWWGVWFIYKKTVFPRLLLHALSFMTFSGWVATLAGWYVTEVGRQPWIVYGIVRTAEVVAGHSSEVLTGTVVAYASLYLFLLISYVGTLHYMAGKPAQSLALLQGEAALQSESSEERA